MVSHARHIHFQHVQHRHHLLPLLHVAQHRRREGVSRKNEERVGEATAEFVDKYLEVSGAMRSPMNLLDIVDIVEMDEGEERRVSHRIEYWALE